MTMTVRQAGKILATKMVVEGEEIPAEYLEAFTVANDWRNLHAPAMKRIRWHVKAFMRIGAIEGDTSARLKRMPAIRDKLARPRTNFKLDTLQDIGGCRAILNSIADVQRLAEFVDQSDRFEVWKSDNYIVEPKLDGYRSHHLCLKVHGRRPGSSEPVKSIELQVRTVLQHAWATAVEAVGAVRRENIKGGMGDAAWRHLFVMMSEEIAEIEGLSDGRSEQRRREIKELDRSIGASDSLDSLAHTIQYLKTAIASSSRPTFFLLRYDAAERMVTVEPHYVDQKAFQSYYDAELADEKSRGNDAVLVDVTEIETVQRAFPNYFRDVGLFRETLQHIVSGKDHRNFSVRPQERSRSNRTREEPVSPGWLHTNRFEGPRPRLKGEKDKRGQKK